MHATFAADERSSADGSTVLCADIAGFETVTRIDGAVPYDTPKLERRPLLRPELEIEIDPTAMFFDTTT